MKEELQADVEAFLAGKRVAIVGLSSNPQDFSCAILEKLEAAGFQVYGVNPSLEEDAGAGRFPTLASIPGDPVDGVFITTAPDVSEQIVRECADLGIGRVWMHQFLGKGSASPEAVAFCKEHGISVIDKGCPMMFVEPVDWFHKTARWCKGLGPVEGVEAAQAEDATA